MKCPKCSHPFEALTPVVNPKRHASVRSRVICEQCYEMSVVTDFGRSVRPATLSEVQTEYPAHLLRAVRFLTAEDVR